MTASLGWLVDCDGPPDTVHVIPVADELDHERAPSCPCLPQVAPVQRETGGLGALVVHDSLDGRERQEVAA